MKVPDSAKNIPTFARGDPETDADPVKLQGCEKLGKAGIKLAASIH